MNIPTNRRVRLSGLVAHWSYVTCRIWGASRVDRCSKPVEPEGSRGRRTKLQSICVFLHLSGEGDLSGVVMTYLKGASPSFWGRRKHEGCQEGARRVRLNQPNRLEPALVLLFPFSFCALRSRKPWRSIAVVGMRSMVVNARMLGDC